MKTNKKKNPYAYFKIRILLSVLGLVLLSTIATGLLYTFFWKNRGGDLLVKFMYHALNLSWTTAHSVYQQVFRNNQTTWWVICTVALFFIPFWVFLNWLTRYFGKIDQGIDQLLTEHPGEIRLCPELSELEGKLNAVRQTLEQRKLEAEVVQQRKNDLVMYLAHDIRTPLTSVIGYLSLLEDAADLTREQRAKYIRITLEKANRLETLVNEFFEITRYQMQKIPLRKETLDLYYLLMQIKEEFYPITEKKGNTIVLEAQEDLTVYADGVKLARVLGNLLKNAASYADPGTEILLSAGKQKDMIRITVENQGPTIPKDKLERVFEQFYRADEARSTEGGGAGLGLAVAREIVNLHGGDICAQSIHGITTFTVTLPAQNNEGDNTQ